MAPKSIQSLGDGFSASPTPPRRRARGTCATSRPDAMVSDPASEAELARLSGAELVDHLRTTHRRADFDAVARVLDARDNRIARVEADLSAAIERERVVADAKAALETALADLGDLRNKYEAFLGAHRRPRDGDGDEKVPLLVQAAATDPVHRDEARVQEVKKEGKVKDPNIIDLCSDEEEEEERAVGPCKEHWESDEDEEDAELLSQRWKRLRRGVPGAVESGKGNGQWQNNLVGTLGNDQQRSSSARMDGPVARLEQIMGIPDDSKVAAFVQGRGVVKLKKFDGEMPMTVLLPSPEFEKSALENGCSTGNHGEAVIGQKKGSFDGVPARGVSEPPNGSVKMSTTTMVESSAKCGNKEVRTGMQISTSPRQSDEGMVSPVRVPFEPNNDESTSIMVKMEISPLPSTITRHWESEGHMITSFVENKELCMQALCALHRQRKLMIENTGLSKIEACRATKLAEFLLDGDPQRPVIRTAEEHDAWFLQQVAFTCSGLLFNIYRNKEDPYFC